MLQNVSYVQIALWSLPITALMLARGILSRRIGARLPGLSDAELGKADRLLRLSSIANQVVVGLGIWIMESPSTDSLVVPLFMTLIVVIWSIGVMANLFSDFPTFVISVPLMIGGNAFFWLLQGDLGLPIGLSMILAVSLMVMFVRRGSTIFRDSILMR